MPSKGLTNSLQELYLGSMKLLKMISYEQLFETSLTELLDVFQLKCFLYLFSQNDYSSEGYRQDIVGNFPMYNWLIWRVLKLAFFSKKNFPCIYFGVWSSQNNAIFM